MALSTASSRQRDEPVLRFQLAGAMVVISSSHRSYSFPTIEFSSLPPGERLQFAMLEVFARGQDIFHHRQVLDGIHRFR